MNIPPFRCADCVIGEFNDYDNTRIVTYEDLKEEAEKTNIIAKNFTFSEEELKFVDFFDLRKSSSLTHFTFCPYCGQRIEWKKLLAQAKQDEKLKERECK